MEITLGDFVKYLVLLLQNSNVVLPFKNQESWHKLFYRVKKENHISGKPSFFKNLQFDWDGAYPKSPELYDFLCILCWTGTVETTSPRYEEYKLSKGMAELLQKRFDALDETIKRYLTSIIGVAREEFVTSRA